MSILVSPAFESAFYEKATLVSLLGFTD